MARLFADRNRVVRLILIAITLLVVLLAVLIVPPWLRAITVLSSPRRAAILFLVGLEIAYLGALATAGLGVPVLGWAFYRARRRRSARPAVARGLLVCAFGLLAFAMAEGTAAAWRAWTHRAPALIAGDAALPDRFADAPSSDELTVAVLGESSAEGIPYESWLSVGRMVTWQLGRAIPGRHFRLELVAHRGDTMADQHRKLAGIRRRPDVLIVYCGHNEFSAGIPWSRRVDHYNDDRPAPLWGLEEGAARLSALCGLIHETADRHRVAMRPPTDLTSPPLVDAPAYSPEEFDARLSDFRRRLEAIAAFGERTRALTILVVPPGNDADFEPNRSFLPAGTPRPVRQAFARDFLAVRRSESSDPAGALERYRKLLDDQPGFAETHYRMGILLARGGRWDEAYHHFEAARDLDGLPIRCIGAFQRAYREVAAGHPDGCLLVDGQALFHGIGQHGLLGDDLFHDAMHPALRGHIALAQRILEALYARRALGWPEEAPAPRVDPAECAAHFHLEPRDWAALAERGAMFYHAMAPLRYDRDARIAKREAFLAAARRIRAGEPPESVGLPNLGVPAEAPLAPDSPARSASRRP